MPRYPQAAPPWAQITAVVLAISFAVLGAPSSPGAASLDQSKAEPELPTAAGPNATTGATAVAKRYMIVAANPLAVAAGREILRQGGSAVDAAITAQLVLNVVEPQSSGIGGGAFMLHFDAKSQQISAFDGRETAPADADPKMFLNFDGKPLKFFDAVVGGLAVGTPGLVALMAEAHQRHGRVDWEQLFAPAIALARDGFAVSPRLHSLIARDKYLKTFAATAAFFYDADGQPWPVGHILKNPALAHTFRIIAKNGAFGFYRGPIAADIATRVQNARQNPGYLTMADIGRYRVNVSGPVCSPYRLWFVCGSPPPSSGGLAVAQMLGLLRDKDLRKFPPSADGALHPMAAHLIAEAGRIAFADRNAYVGDPAFTPVPIAGMIDKKYLARRAQLIDPTRALGKVAPGVPPGVKEAMAADPDGVGGYSTTHISVIDAAGNALSMTSSIENAFGSRMMVRGFLLNNQLTDFSFVPERDGKPVANRAEPGKRPRSSMAPTLVFDWNGQPVLATGSPGGSRIIGYVAQSLIAVLDWNLSPQAAAALPHVVNRNGPTELETDSPAQSLQAALEAKGHKVRTRPMTSGLHLIKRAADGTLHGGADPRREGIALGD